MTGLCATAAEVSGTANRAMPLPQVIAPIAIRGA